MNKNSLLTIDRLSKQDIVSLLTDAFGFQEKYQDWQLGTSVPVANLFFENSTRTHYSFAFAELGLGLKVEDIMASTSSVTKGESIYDTCKTLESIGYKALVIRSPIDNYFDQLDNIRIPILNAGDGCGNHPTQCLLDLYTIFEHFHHIEGLKVCIIGDILHSRVANSDYQALKMFGADVVFSGPEEFKREGFPFVDIDTAIAQSDVVMLLRIQFERLNLPMTITKEEYHENFGLTLKRYKTMKKDSIIMHPAPVNRGIEIDSSLVESEKSVIFRQMTNGVYVRKAALKRAFGFEPFGIGEDETGWRF